MTDPLLPDQVGDLRPRDLHVAAVSGTTGRGLRRDPKPGAAAGSRRLPRASAMRPENAEENVTAFGG
jgi:hypothetical protein